MTGDRTSVDLVPDALNGIREALARLAAVAQQPVEPLSSVEITRTTRGATWTVKVYDRNPAGASELAQALYDELGARCGAQQEPSA